MRGDLLDAVLVVAAVLFAVSGYRQGFVVGVLSFVGFLGGGVLGAKLAPGVAEMVDAVPGPVVALSVVFVLASIGQVVATVLGGFVRNRMTFASLRQADALAGAVVSVVSLLLVAWLVGTALASSPYPTVSSQIRRSIVITTVDDAVPDPVRRFFSSFRDLVDERGFPEVFSGLTATQVREVPPPDPAVARSRAVQVARDEILKITGVAQACGRRIEGTGFVYAPERVMTNAHVVAGVRRPMVEVGEDEQLPATVVVFDPGRDLAVLAVPGLRRSPLSFAPEAEPGASAVVAGYPEDGPFTASAARVRQVQRARGPDIYQERNVVREIYALRARVRPGNSGGPLLAPDGRVYGVIFAAAADRNDTGYALTAAEAAPVAQAGRTRSEAVSTRRCD